MEQSPKYWWRLAAAMLTGVVLGWSDATPGPLIPRWEEEYNLTYLQASLVFVAISGGFLTMILAIEPISSLAGVFLLPMEEGSSLSWQQRPKAFSRQQANAVTTGIGCFIHLVYFVVPASHPPFYGIVIAAFIGGNGQAAVFAQMNTYPASQPRTSLLLGCFHASYGLGALTSPLVSTSLLARGWHYHRFYYIGTGLSILNMFCITTAFWPDSAERDADIRRHLEDSAATSSEATEDMKAEVLSRQVKIQLTGKVITLPTCTSLEPSPSRSAHPASSMREAIRSRFAWFMAVFMFLYQGIEVTTGGWIVTFILDVRGADPKFAGYAATGFWAGMTVGRASFAIFSHFVDWRVEKHVVHAAMFLSLAVILVVWFVDSVLAAALGAALIGVLQGPVIQVTVMVMGKLTKPKTLLNTISFSTSLSCLGGAVIPFMCGAVSSARGAVSLMPILVFLCSAMTIAWACVPTRTGVSGNLLFGLGGRKATSHDDPIKDEE